MNKQSYLISSYLKYLGNVILRNIFTDNLYFLPTLFFSLFVGIEFLNLTQIGIFFVT